MFRACEWRKFVLVSWALLLCHAAGATEVAIAGMFGNKAVLVVDGGAPRTVAVGQRTPEGVRLLALEGEVALVDIGGVRERIRLGERVVQRVAAGGAELVHLEADSQGHFFINGQVNGAAIRFLVDTGASLVSMGRSDARRFGIDLTKARAASSQTASGVRRVWLVKLDAVRIGAMVLNDVEAAVHENDLPIALLGMSFLSRMEMTHEGSRLVLKRRY